MATAIIRNDNTKKETKKLLEGAYLVMHMWPYVASSFNIVLVYVTLPSMCEINKLGVEGGLKIYGCKHEKINTF